MIVIFEYKRAASKAHYIGCTNAPLSFTAGGQRNKLVAANTYESEAPDKGWCDLAAT